MGCWRRILFSVEHTIRQCRHPHSFIRATIDDVCNPPHPGESINNVYLEPHGGSGRELATKLDVTTPTSGAS